MSEGARWQGIALNRPLAIISVVIAAWGVAVTLYARSMPAPQGVYAGGALFAVGCLIAGMGYLSMLRREALRKRESSLKKILEERRREREQGNKGAREQGRGTG